MATVIATLHPLGPFNFHTPEEWTKWSKRFDQFRLAPGLSEKLEEKQVSTFVCCFRKQAEEFLLSMGAGETDHATYQAICAKLDDYFAVWHNIIHERARFNCQIQEPGKIAAEACIHALLQYIP